MQAKRLFVVHRFGRGRKRLKCRLHSCWAFAMSSFQAKVPVMIAQACVDVATDEGRPLENRAMRPADGGLHWQLEGYECLQESRVKVSSLDKNVSGSWREARTAREKSKDQQGDDAKSEGAEGSWKRFLSSGACCGGINGEVSR